MRNNVEVESAPVEMNKDLKLVTTMFKKIKKAYTEAGIPVQSYSYDEKGITFILTGHPIESHLEFDRLVAKLFGVTTWAKDTKKKYKGCLLYKGGDVLGQDGNGGVRKIHKFELNYPKFSRDEE